MAHMESDAREVVALELFRLGKLTHHALSQFLGLDRFETDALLKRHNVCEHSLTMDDLDSDRRTLEHLLNAGGAGNEM